MRSLIKSIVMLVIMFLLLGNVTLAWINLPKINSVDDISFSVKINTTLDISLDGINYNTEISNSEISKVLKEVVFKDITSSDGLTFTNSEYSKDKKDIVANKDYISLDIHFRTKSERAKVYLANNLTRDKMNYQDKNTTDTFIISRGVYFTPAHSYHHSETEIRNSNNTYLYYGSDAIRISTVDLNDNNKTKIFDLSENEQRGFGKNYGASDYYYQNTGVLVKAPEPPNVIYGLSKFDENNNANSDKSLITTLIKEEGTEYYKGIVRFNIWMEGFDADSFQAIANDLIKIQLIFKNN